MFNIVLIVIHSITIILLILSIIKLVKANRRKPYDPTEDVFKIIENRDKDTNLK